MTSAKATKQQKQLKLGDIVLCFRYGDRSPRSFFARAFSFVWIMIGLVIISIFTATVTTSLTAISLSNDIKLYGSNVSRIGKGAQMYQIILFQLPYFEISQLGCGIKKHRRAEIWNSKQRKSYRYLLFKSTYTSYTRDKVLNKNIL